MNGLTQLVYCSHTVYYIPLKTNVFTNLFAELVVWWFVQFHLGGLQFGSIVHDGEGGEAMGTWVLDLRLQFGNSCFGFCSKRLAMPVKFVFNLWKSTAYSQKKK